MTEVKIHLPDSPFPGIDPFSYSERNVFFAREQESRKLIRLVTLYRGVLLYSSSGIGKSSLINAGFLPRAISEGFQMERLRVQPQKDAEIVVERLSLYGRTGPPYLPSIFSPDEDGNEDEERIVLSVASFLEIIRQKAESTHPLLVFDQFEEWFTLFEETAKGRQSASQTLQTDLRDAILSLLRDSRLPVKVLLVLREDYLAKLTPFFNRYPDLPDQYLRLTPLEGADLKRIIRGPFDTYPTAYPREISTALTQKIRNQFEGRSEDEPVRLSEVQIVCHTLYETGKVEDQLETYFGEHGGVKGILEEYLESALESLPENQRHPAVGLLSRMVTPVGTRNSISKDDLISLVESEEEQIGRELLEETLDNLEQKTKLVRRERRREVYYYEIVSEFLIDWIQRKTLERRERLKVQQLERENEKIKVDLQHVSADLHTLTISHFELRRIIGLLGLSLPFLLSAGLAFLFGEGIPPSIGQFYHTPISDLYVVLIGMIGILLMSYRGYYPFDSLAGKVAAVSILSAALFPPTVPGAAGSIPGYLHGSSLLLFFLANIFMSLFLFTRTNPTRWPERKKLMRNKIYRMCGYMMILCLLLIAAYSIVPASVAASLTKTRPVFWLETVAFSAFGISWLTKGQAILRDEG